MTAVDAAAMRRRTTNDNAVDIRCLARAVSNIIHRGASTGEPPFALESCRVVDAGRLPTQHLSDGSYFATVNPVLHEGKRHAVCVRRGRGRRAQIKCNNQIVDDVEYVERYCGNCALWGGVCIGQGQHQR